MKTVFAFFPLVVMAFLLSGFSQPDHPSCDALPQRLIAAGNFEAAQAYYDKVVETAPESFDAYQNRAFFFLKINRKQDALRDFSTMVTLKPDVTSTYIGRAFIYSEMGERVNAEADFQRACTLGDAGGCTFARESAGGE